MKQETLDELIIINISGKSETVTRRHAIELILDSKEFMSDLYEGLDEEKRIELGQFYTPAKICIQMIEKFSWDSLAGKNIMDPTCGSGNLLIACLIAGADLDKLYGNEYDAVAVKLCKKRLLRAAEKLGLDLTKFRDWQIHQGNALQARCLVDFSPEYCGVKIENGDTLPHYQAKYINDLEYAQTYDHDIEEEMFGEVFTRHEEAMSWRWENEHAAERAKEKAKIEAKKKAAEEEAKAKAAENKPEQLSLF